MSLLTNETTASPSSGGGAYLDVRDLQVHFTTDDGVVKSVDGLSFHLERGQTLGIVGESGSGKSVTSMAVMGLHTAKNATISGSIMLDGQELVGADPDVIRRLRGKKMAMIFQDPLSSMHPFYTVGNQIIEAYRIHNNVSKKAARAHAIEMLDRVGIPEPSQRIDAYPHQFSGGMRQRAMIAMSLSCDPDLLIADEPTTALDVTVQAQILDLIRDLQKEFNSAVVIITHDLGVVAELADDIMVMYAGRAAEYGSAEQLFNTPEHPYTWGLLGSMPRFDKAPTARLLPDQGNAPEPDQRAQGVCLQPAVRLPGAGRLCVPERATRPGRQQQRPLRGLPHPARRAPQHLGAGDLPEAAVTTPSPEATAPAASTPETLLKVEGLVKHFPIKGGFLSRPRPPYRQSTAWTSRYAAARRSRSWASPAAARAPPRG